MRFLGRPELGSRLRELIPNAERENDDTIDDAMGRLGWLPGEGLSLAWREKTQELAQRLRAEPREGLTIDGA